MDFVGHAYTRIYVSSNLSRLNAKVKGFIPIKIFLILFRLCHHDHLLLNFNILPFISAYMGLS